MMEGPTLFRDLSGGNLPLISSVFTADSRKKLEKAFWIE